MKATKTPQQRQYITDPWESSAYAKWYQDQPKDPGKVYADPVAAFRAHLRRQQT